MRILVNIANDRFKINAERISRFRQALMHAFQAPNSLAGKSGDPEWEDADARKRRKREEGLARQKELQVQRSSAAADGNTVDFDITLQ